MLPTLHATGHSHMPYVSYVPCAMCLKIRGLGMRVVRSAQCHVSRLSGTAIGHASIPCVLAALLESNNRRFAVIGSGARATGLKEVAARGAMAACLPTFVCCCSAGYDDAKWSLRTLDDWTYDVWCVIVCCDV